MFKRQFYAVEHADNDNDDDDASSSDSSVNTGSDDDSAHEQEDDDAASPNHAQQAPGSEESDEEGDGDGEPESEDDEWNAYRDKNVKQVQAIDSSHFLSKKPTAAATATEAVDESAEDKAPESVGDGVVLRVKGVLKCRFCVKVLCLSDESMTQHLLSKGHARSLKLLASGKLSVRLNSDGEEEEEGETHAERLERIRSVAEEKVLPVKRKANKGRQRQRKRAKKRAGKAERALAKSAKQKSE